MMAKINFKVPSAAAHRAPVDVARSFIAAGIAVFPCREKTTEGIDYATGEIVDFVEKSPYTSDGLKGATTSIRIVNILFGERHPGAAIGVPTGEKLGAWVLDLDRRQDDDGESKDGNEWLTAMEAIHGPLPDTARAKTANGGTHIFFKHIDGIRNRAAIAPGVDTRGEGGYILAPGSVMADGRRYEWVNWDSDGLPEFADAPDWLVDMVKTKTIAASNATYSGTTQATGSNPVYVDRAVQAELDDLARTPQGGRNEALNTSAFKLGRLVGGGHLSENDARSSLESIAQQWPNFHKSKGTIGRGLREGMAQPREVPAPSYADNDNTRVDPERIKTMIANTVARKAEETATGQEASEPVADGEPIMEQPAAAKPKRERFEKTWFDQIEEGKPKETFIKGVLGCREFTTVSGLPGTGKSVIVTDMACHVAIGKDWHGKRVKQGLVIYVAAERKSLTERRMMAFRKEHDAHNVPLLVIGGRLDFTKDLKDARDLISAIKEAETETGIECVWVIIDTLTRVFGAGDQNASKDMTKFVQACDEILAETKAHVTAIHHSAWSGERGKGAIDLDGAVDASFMVKKDNGKYKLVCDGTNDGDEGDVLGFTMKSVEIGRDEEGEPTTAPVVVATNGEAGKLTSGIMKGYRGDALAALTAAIEKHGIEPEGDAFPDDVMVVDEQTWRTEFYNSRDTSNASGAETARKQFQRAPRQLVESGHVNNIGLWYWPSGAT